VPAIIFDFTPSGPRQMANECLDFVVENGLAIV
jgi:hypothetical protein